MNFVNYIYIYFVIDLECLEFGWYKYFLVVINILFKNKLWWNKKIMFLGNLLNFIYINE